MARGLILAPVAIDVAARFPNLPVVKIPGATDGTRQVWDTLDAERADALGLRVRTGYEDVPWGLRIFLLQVRRSDSQTANTNLAWKRLSDCGAGDWIRVADRTAGTISRKRRGQIGFVQDVLVNVRPWHRWAGSATYALAGGEAGDVDELGNPNDAPEPVAARPTTAAGRAELAALAPASLPAEAVPITGPGSPYYAELLAKVPAAVRRARAAAKAAAAAPAAG